MFRLSTAGALVTLGLLAIGCSSSPSQTDANRPIGPVSEKAQPYPPTYPAKSLEQVKALAQFGDGTRLQIIRRENRPNGSCNGPNVYALVDRKLRGEGLANAELSTFQDESAFDAPCPAFLYVFHTRSESRRGGYTAGAVIYDGGLLDVYVGGLASSPVIHIKTR